MQEQSQHPSVPCFEHILSSPLEYSARQVLVPCERALLAALDTDTPSVAC